MNRIKLLREEQGIQQTELAEKLNVSQGTLSNWERGVHDPDNTSLIELSMVFNVSVDFIIGNSDYRTPEDIFNALKETTGPYYADAETDELAETLHKTPGMRILFDASRNLNKDDLEFLAEMAKKMKGGADDE